MIDKDECPSCGHPMKEHGQSGCNVRLDSAWTASGSKPCACSRKFGAPIPTTPVEVEHAERFDVILRHMQEACETHSWWKKRMDGTPLANDIPVRCAEVASKMLTTLRAKVQAGERLAEAAHLVCASTVRHDSGLSFTVPRDHFIALCQAFSALRATGKATPQT